MMIQTKRCTMAASVILMLLAGAASAQTGANYLPWMLGCWASTDTDPVEMERWSTSSNGLSGTRETVRDGIRVQLETMTITRDDSGTVILTATPAGQASTIFFMVEINSDEVAFENREHDFPQRIIYRLLPGFRLLGRAEGIVDGQARAVDFPMTRVDCT